MRSSVVCGIYKIANSYSGKFYIGCSSDIKHRWLQHRSALRRGVHYNNHLQHAWNKYGEGVFVFEVVEQTDEINLLEREQHWIDKLNAILEGYNISEIAERKAGHSWSEESRAKMRGNTHTLGYKHTNEAKAKMSAHHTGLVRSEEAKENYRIAATIREAGKRMILDPNLETEPAWLKNWRSQ